MTPSVHRYGPGSTASPNACLTALESTRRRPLPVGLSGPSDDPDAPLVPDLEVSWLEPFPDLRADDPAGVAVERESLRLAFVAALQTLPAQQRAALILREVLQYTAAEIAACLNVSVSAVNSALQRARAATPVDHDLADGSSRPADPRQRATLEAYITAFERADIDALAALLRADVVLKMPPVPNWYAGIDHYCQFMARVYTMRGRSWRTITTQANGQPAFAAYALGPDDAFHAHTLQVLTILDDSIVHNVVFADPTQFPAFELPAVIHR